MFAKRIAATLVLGAGVVVGAAQSAPAQPGGPGFGKHGRHGPPPIDRVLERHAEELGLSDETRARVREIAEAAEARVEPLEAALRSERDAMHALLSQDTPDLDAVLRQADAVGAAETAMHKERLRTLLAVRVVLTPEQRAKLVKIFDEKMRKHAPRDGPPHVEPRIEN